MFLYSTGTQDENTRHENVHESLVMTSRVTHLIPRAYTKTCVSYL